MNSAVAVSPCAAAISWTTRTADSRTRARDSGENERMVTSSLASSGMTLFVVPAWKLPTVMTTGSKMSKRRVTSTCSAVTISQATGIGSAAWCGWEPWPPRPVTVMSSDSAAAIIGPCRVLNTPKGSSADATCSA